MIAELKLGVEEYIKNLEAVFAILITETRQTHEAQILITKEQEAKAHETALNDI